MGSILEKILWKIGFYGPIPSPPIRPGIGGPYAYLHDLPRHQPATLQLDDHPFEIADGFSFYWMHKEIYRDEIIGFDPREITHSSSIVAPIMASAWLGLNNSIPTRASLQWKLTPRSTLYYSGTLREEATTA
jgi:hypothetical protein